MKRILPLFLSLTLLASSLSAGIAYQPPQQPDPNPPAPIVGAPRPTLQVSPSHGLPGAVLTVSGAGVAPYPGVRIAWLDADTTATLQEATLDGNGNYSTTIRIPAGASPGAGRVCAAVTGTHLAAFECKDVTVDTPPPGGLSGALPLALAGQAPSAPAFFDARLNLYDQQGNVVAGAPIQSNGAYTLSNVPPGTYTAGVTGSVPVLVQNATVSVQSGQQATFNPQPFSACTKGSVVGVRLTPTGKATSTFDFGSYVNYWPYTEAGPNVVFQVDMQVLNNATLGLMVLRADDNNGDVSILVTADPPPTGYTYEFDRWLADVDVGIRNFSFEPFVTYSPSGCAVQYSSRRVHIVEHPMQLNGLQQYVDRRVNDLVWDGSRYVFDVKIPSNYTGYQFLIPFFSINGEQKLPITFPDPIPLLDYIGPVENITGGAAFNAGGTLDLDGNVTFNMLRTATRSSPMNLPSAIVGEKPMLPENTSLPLESLAGAASAGLPLLEPRDVGADLVNQLRQAHYDIPPTRLFGFSESVPVYEGVLFSAAGLLNVRVSITLGIKGDMYYEGTIRPLAPSLDAVATADIRPSLYVSVLMDALLGVASAGGTAQTEADVRFPIRLDSDDPRFVWMQDPCMQITTTFYLWARVNLLFASASWNSDPQVILDYREGVCPARPQALAAEPPPPPRLLASPEAASGPGGRLLAVYVEDNAPAAATPAPRVMARLWDSANSQWGAATALTNGTRMVQDPVAAFYGPDGRAMAAWTENPMTQAEELAAGNNLNAILRRQEIYYATYNGSAWSAPVRLTNDQLPDGQAAIAGDAQGITLAWMQDTDGDLATHLDWRIAVRSWDPAGNTWSTLELLNGSASPVSNYQVSADRQMENSNSRRVLAWTVDADGDQGTTSDRHIEVYDWDGDSWNRDATNTLPSRSEAPQVAYVPGGQDLFLTYLIRNNDKSGSPGGVGNLGALQTARRNFGGIWNKFAVLDTQGDPVRAEQPRLDVAPDGTGMVLFRRWGATSTNAELGQMAYAPLKPTGEAYPPLDLTDEPRQHWQPALAINQANSQAVFLNVGRLAPAAAQAGILPAAATAATSGAMPLSTDSDPVESAVILPGSDPALDSSLEVSQYHAAPGDTLTITATVRNLGPATATGVNVALYAGESPGGALIDQVAVGSLTFNQSQAVAFQVTAASGSQPVYARVSAASANTSSANDEASAALGELLAPSLVSVQAIPTSSTALRVIWQAPAMPGIAGYRILRSPTPGGPYELVGETSRTLYTDYLLQGGTTYYYVVQTYDAAGALSAFSAEASAAPPSGMIYLPRLAR